MEEGQPECYADAHIKGLIPVRVQSLLHDARCMRLLGVDCDDSERIWEAKHIALGQAICGYNCVKYIELEPCSHLS